MRADGHGLEPDHNTLHDFEKLLGEARVDLRVRSPLSLIVCVLPSLLSPASG